MYQSLERHSKDFHLYIFAFDSDCYSILNDFVLKNATIISLNELENDELLAVKSSRTPGEYCWTCTPATLKYCIQNYKLDHCTYIDSDLLFYADPNVLIDELGTASVLITEHRYTAQYNHYSTAGKYCVQFITFRNNNDGILALNWWYNACLEWCFNREEDNKFGDQKYLDDWTTRFNGVHELKHLGGGVAPWNVQQYVFKDKNGVLLGKESISGKEFEVIFFHYHGLKYCKGNIFFLGDYGLNKNVLHLIYKPYIQSLNYTEGKLMRVNPKANFHEQLKIKWMWKSIRRTVLILLRGYYKKYYHQKYLLKSGLSN